MPAFASEIEDIRALSRRLVREWGFTGDNFAGTELSPSAVHALIEIERGGVTARELAAQLRLEKSSVSRMLQRMVASGDVVETFEERDGRVKLLTLTRTGRKRVAAIHHHAGRQVAAALGLLSDDETSRVLDGLRLYTDALAGRAPAPVPAEVRIVRGYRTGLIARVTELHAHYYAREAGFGQRFESGVAGGLAELCERLGNPANAIWAALQGDAVIGSISIDGEDLGANSAHLRYFIVDGRAHGTGVGRRLLAAALAFVDERGFDATQLWTFGHLTAARQLYERHGFVCAEERPGDQWGKRMVEQRFVRPRP